jgi:hypothetical protein
LILIAWRWFVIITITGQLFAEFLNLQLPAVDFNLLEALRELAISQAKPLHYGFVHPLAADCRYLNAILPSFAGISQSSIGKVSVSAKWLANSVTIAARAFGLALGVVISIAAHVDGLTLVAFFSFQPLLFKLHGIAPLILMTKAPAVTTRTAAICESWFASKVASCHICRALHRHCQACAQWRLSAAAQWPAQLKFSYELTTDLFGSFRYAQHG